MNPETPHLTLTVADRVATLTLRKPERRNAVDQAMWRAIPALAARLSDDPAVAVIVLTGAGDCFSAGADIAEFETVFGTTAAATAAGDAIRLALRALSAINKPVIATIRGQCIGGGVSLALTADLRLATEESRFAIPPARLGLVYSHDETKRLVEAVGPAGARDLLFTARTIDARDALAMGLVDRVVAPERLDAEAGDLIETLLSNAPGSIRGAKLMIRAILDGGDHETPALRALADNAVSSPDFREGYRAFLAKRRPVFDQR